MGGKAGEPSAGGFSAARAARNAGYGACQPSWNSSKHDRDIETPPTALLSKTEGRLQV
jgi:hypothetical protein